MPASRGACHCYGRLFVYGFTPHYSPEYSIRLFRVVQPVVILHPALRGREMLIVRRVINALLGGPVEKKHGTKTNALQRKAPPSYLLLAYSLAVLSLVPGFAPFQASTQAGGDERST